MTIDSNIKVQFDILKNYIDLSSFDLDIVKGDETKIENNTLYYKKKSELFNAILMHISGSKYKHLPLKEFGLMIDCARNAVASLNNLKRIIVIMSLLGYNFLGLYLEDCFEVNNEPKFGYMRGKYTKEELKEIVEFGDLFGIKIIPYIETLAHMDRIFNHWAEYYNTCHSMHDCLLVGENRTYELIDHMISTLKEIFKVDTIHVGLDEPFTFTDGKFKELNGEQDKCKVFFEHLNKVKEIASKYGYKIECFGDAFLKYNVKIEDETKLTIWEYFNDSKEKNIELINKYKSISNNLTFATASHSWYGFAPYNYYSKNIINSAIDACIESKIDKLVITTWKDDGAECSTNLIIPSLISGSIHVNSSEEYLNKYSKILTGYNYSELLELDNPNRLFDHEVDWTLNPSKYLFYEDIFYGIDDKPDNRVYKSYFKKNMDILKSLTKRKTFYSYEFKNMYNLNKVLFYKNNIRLDLIDAYKEKDKKKLRIIIKDINLTIKALYKFDDSNKISWFINNKPQGFEVMEIRIAGLIDRMKYIKNTVNNYLKGKLDKIEELEETNLSPIVTMDRDNGCGRYNNYSMNVTPGVLSKNTYI